MAIQKHQEQHYDLKSVKLPYLSGFILRLVTWLLESPLRGFLMPSLFQNAGISWFGQQSFDEPPTYYPIHFSSVFDYALAYQNGRFTPNDMAAKVLASIEASDKADSPLHAFIAVNQDDVYRQAEQATKRIKSGKRLSIFDGVPVAVKDEIDMIPYSTTIGTSFLGTIPATEDATVVARLRAAGAILIGKTNMYEIGIGVTGFNQFYGTPKNPYHPDHYTDGSSSGSAAAVAAGLCPVAIGADGGGSIRIPASFCGLVEIMRFVTPANLTGLPAISFPVGYNEKGLPIGMHAMGRAWQEQTLLRLALCAETCVKKKTPQIFLLFCQNSTYNVQYVSESAIKY